MSRGDAFPENLRKVPSTLKLVYRVCLFIAVQVAQIGERLKLNKDIRSSVCLCSFLFCETLCVFKALIIKSKQFPYCGDTYYQWDIKFNKDNELHKFTVVFSLFSIYLY